MLMLATPRPGAPAPVSKTSWNLILVTLAGQAEYPLADDVQLDLDRPAADQLRRDGQVGVGRAGQPGGPRAPPAPDPPGPARHATPPHDPSPPRLSPAPPPRPRP